MRADPATVLSTGSSVPIGLEYRGGEFGELVIVYNPSTNSNNVFLSLNRDATTAAVTGQVTVPPGQFSIPFILNAKDNASGINAIAATGTTVVTVLRAPFLTQEEYNAAVIAFGVGLAAGNFWVAISGTQIQLSGAFVEARVNTLRTKTTGGALAMQNDTGAPVFNAATGANGNVDVVAPGSGQADLATSAGEDFIGVRTADSRLVRNNVQLFGVTDTEFAFTNLATAPVTFINTASNERHRINATHRIRRMNGNDETDGVNDAEELPIVNGQVLAAGDLVMWVAPNRCKISTLAAATSVVGRCVSGGTGDAGGTIKAVIETEGWLVNVLVADDAGVTAGQHLLQGATDVGQVASQATIEGTFALCTESAASGVVTSCRLHGPMG